MANISSVRALGICGLALLLSGCNSPGAEESSNISSEPSSAQTSSNATSTDQTTSDQVQSSETSEETSMDDTSILPSVEDVFGIVQDTLEVKRNGKGQLDVYIPTSITENRKVSWTVEDETVATISSSGIVSGHNTGTTTITATCKADSTLTDTVTITVDDNQFDQDDSYFENDVGSYDWSDDHADGSVEIKNGGDSVLIFAGGSAKNYYVSSTIYIHSFNYAEQYSKIGFMSGARDGIQGTFLYLDTQSVYSSWNATGYNTRSQTGSWGSWTSSTTLSSKITYDEGVQLEMIRNDGTLYFLVNGQLITKVSDSIYDADVETNPIFKAFNASITLEENQSVRDQTEIDAIISGYGLN